MADAEGPKPTNIWALFEILLVLFVILAVFERLPEMIERRTGFDILDPKGSYQRLSTVNEDTPLGTGIRLGSGVDVFSAPGGGRALGFQKQGARGSLYDGWTLGPGGRWWFVDFEEGVDGWVEEAVLQNGAVMTARRALLFTFYFLSTAIILVGGALVLYLVYRINGIRAAEVRSMKTAVATAQAENGSRTAGKNARWLGVVREIESENPNDWRSAIIESDIMLDELVTRMGYRGESLGEKLKQIEKSDFITLDAAWEAHKVRNLIAHGGSDFVLSKREALRVVDLYRQVFEEFKFI